ncbi:MAG: hypothetical protein LBU37_10330 [Tannerellaceae bacterium]|jgi:hypothetical protein|nr:hypothetical protein [Tannerellaceae bacterium]
MRKVFKFLSKEKGILLSLLCLVIGLLAGGGSGMLYAEVVAGSPGVLGKVDDSGLQTQLTGKDGSVTTLENSGDGSEIIIQEIDEDIAKFRPEFTPLDSIIRQAVSKRMRGNYEVKHYQIGVERAVAETTTAYTGVAASKRATLAISADDADIFQQYMTINVKGVSGYDSSGATATGVDLMLYVVGINNTSGLPIVMAINGKKANATDKDTYVPSIPAGSELYVMQNAGSESQMFVPPSNYTPVPTVKYMQRQIVNTKFTEYFKNVKREVPYDEQDIVEQALYEFKRKTEKTYLLGVQGKIVSMSDPNVPNRGAENVYFMGGIYWDIKKFYEYTEGAFTYNNLLSITKMQFAGNNGSKQAFFGVGCDLAEEIHTIDYSIYKDLTIETKKQWGIEMRSYKSIFGTINLVQLPVLDETGRSKEGIVLDLDRFVRYVMRDQKSQKIDLAVTGEEAERNVTTIIDCPALKGFNHMIVRPE